MSCRSSSHDFRSHVLNGAAERECPKVSLVRREVFAETKVSQDDVSIRVEENVLQLNVSINDTQFVQVFEGKDNLSDVNAHFILGKVVSLVEMSEQFSSAYVVCKRDQC